jgi:hypothetical protein
MPPRLGRALAACLAIAAVAGCADPRSPGKVTSVSFAPLALPKGVAQANADLVEDFLDYTFELESGERLDRLLRYEMPVRVHLRSPGLDAYRPDAEDLIARLRREAEIDIALVDDAAAAQIVIETVPRAQIDRVYPEAACFIVPGERSWQDFVRKRPERILRWADQTTLGEAAIFLPADTTPQDVRDCLNEELTQALGPANDLYRVADSIWNDDNLHAVATAYNMLLLRVLYQPELRSGMTRAEVAARLPALFDRLNPQGRDLPRRPRHPESRAWASAIELALSRRVSFAERRGAAEVAVTLARGMKPVDHRLAVSLLALGRLTLRRDPALAAAKFAGAYNLSLRLHGLDDIRTAHAGIHLAAVALSAGQPGLALRLAREHVPGALAGRNAVLLAGLRAIEADALAALGEEAEARKARLDSLRWARYGLGDRDGTLAREQAEIAALLRIDG